MLNLPMLRKERTSAAPLSFKFLRKTQFSDLFLITTPGTETVENTLTGTAVSSPPVYLSVPLLLVSCCLPIPYRYECLISLKIVLPGPIVGGSFDVIDSSSVPRAVSKDYFDIVCPKHQRVVVDTREIKVRLEKNGAGAKDMMKAWSDMLNAIPDKCVEIEQDAPILFDYM